jgi:hypothetical protein
VARGVDKVELVFSAVGGSIVELDGAGFYRYPALALEVHIVEDLVLHLARRYRARKLEHAVGESGFTVIYMGYDAEIPYIFPRGQGHRLHMAVSFGRKFRAAQI